MAANKASEALTYRCLESAVQSCDDHGFPEVCHSVHEYKQLQGRKRVRNGITYHTREQHATYIREELALIDADDPVLANEVRHLFKGVA